MAVSHACVDETSLPQELSTGEWEPIADADAMTYIPEDHDVGYMLKVQLTVHEPGFGSLFALTEFVVLGTKEPKAHVTIQSGFPLEGETLEASTHVVWCVSPALTLPQP